MDSVAITFSVILGQMQY